MTDAPTLFRHFTLTIATAALLAGFAATASAKDLKPMTVVLSYIPNVENFGALYAKANGYFEEAGLDVTLVPGGQGIDQIQMVSAGVAQLAMTEASTVIAAVDKGEELKVIAAEFQKSPTAMTCRADSGITKPSMLAGKRLGVKQSAQVYAATFLAKNGVDIKSVNITTIGNSDIATIIAGKVDCILTTFAFNEPRLIEQAGVPVTVLPVADWGFSAQSGVWVVKADFLKDAENQKMLVAYLGAEAKAWKVFFKDPAAAAKFVIDGKFNDGLDLGQQSYQAVEQAKYMTSKLTAEKGIFWVDDKTWSETTKNALDAGATSKLIDPSKIITTEILEKADVPKL